MSSHVLLQLSQRTAWEAADSIEGIELIDTSSSMLTFCIIVNRYVTNWTSHREVVTECRGLSSSSSLSSFPQPTRTKIFKNFIEIAQQISSRTNLDSSHFSRFLECKQRTARLSTSPTQRRTWRRFLFFERTEFCLKESQFPVFWYQKSF